MPPHGIPLELALTSAAIRSPDITGPPRPAHERTAMALWTTQTPGATLLAVPTSMLGVQATLEIDKPAPGLSRGTLGTFFGYREIGSDPDLARLLATVHRVLSAETRAQLRARLESAGRPGAAQA